MTWGTIAYLLGRQVLGGAGVALVILALVGDRLRGNHKKRRCPKCRYDMAGTPGLTCPECGRAATRERALFRTRRRWSWAAVGLAAMLGGPVVGLWPWMSWMNAFPLLPVRVQAEVWPWLEDRQFASNWLKSVRGTPELTPVIRRRVAKELAAWPTAAASVGLPQRQMLVLEAIEQVPSDPELEAALAAMYKRGGWGRTMALRPMEVHPGAIELVVDTVAQEALFGPDASERYLSMRLLGVVAARNETAAAALAEGVVAGDEVSATAAWGLIAGLPGTKGVVDELIAKDDNGVNLELMQAMRDWGAATGVCLTPWLVEQMFSGKDGLIRATAWSAMRKLGAQADPLLADELDRRVGKQRGMMLGTVQGRRTHDPELLAALERVALDETASFKMRRTAMLQYNFSVQENALAVEPLVVMELWGPGPKWNGWTGEGAFLDANLP